MSPILYKDPNVPLADSVKNCNPTQIHLYKTSQPQIFLI